jgi:hypothetical protein
VGQERPRFFLDRRRRIAAAYGKLLSAITGGGEAAFLRMLEQAPAADANKEDDGMESALSEVRAILESRGPQAAAAHVRSVAANVR